MKEFKDKVAVITGAASGIGFSLAKYATQLGMRCVLADIDKERLEQADKSLSKISSSERVLIDIDVSSFDAIKNLADQTIKEFNQVNLLFNNAGVGVTGPKIWEFTMKDWEWVLNVNLWSVIYATNVFLPIMLKQESESHIINTASAAGLLSPRGYGPYSVSKHGVVTISEVLYNDLKSINNTNINVSVLCPGLINTEIYSSHRNRPQNLQNRIKIELKRQEEFKNYQLAMEASLKKGMHPDEVAEMTFKAIENNQFYIITHQWIKDAVKTRSENMIENKPPFLIS